MKLGPNYAEIGTLVNPRGKKVFVICFFGVQTSLPRILIDLLIKMAKKK